MTVIAVSEHLSNLDKPFEFIVLDLVIEIRLQAFQTSFLTQMG